MLHALVQEARLTQEKMEKAKRRSVLWSFPEISGRWRVSDEDMCQLLDGAATLRVKDWAGEVPWVSGPNGLVAGTAWENKSAVEQGKPPPGYVAPPEKSGGSVDYYKVLITNPTSKGDPYTAECNDVIEALGMDYAEGNAFKAIWRSCAERTLGKKKVGGDAVYDAEKVIFFGTRMLAKRKEKAKCS